MPAKIENIVSFRADEEWVVIVLVAHLGDIIACEPIIRYVKETCPDKKIAWVVLKQYTEILTTHPDLDSIVEVESLVEATLWVEKVRNTCRVINLHFHKRNCPVTKQEVINTNSEEVNEDNYYAYGSLLEAFTTAAGLPALRGAPRYYCIPDVEAPVPPGPYVVFHGKSNNDDLKDWHRKEWLKLYTFFSSLGMYFVEVGLSPVLGIEAPFYRDMTHVNSLNRIAVLIQHAHFFIGIDSAFAHLANALGANGLVVAGVHDNWKRYTPYTGPYRSGRIVHADWLPARYLEAEKVIARYQQLQNSPPTGEKEHAPDAHAVRMKKSDFPNKHQKIILSKAHRPFVKRFAREHYSLFVKYPDLYFRLSPPSDPVLPFFRWLLSALGSVPAQSSSGR